MAAAVGPWRGSGGLHAMDMDFDDAAIEEARAIKAGQVTAGCWNQPAPSGTQMSTRFVRFFDFAAGSLLQAAGPSTGLLLFLAGFGGFLSSSGANVMAYSEFRRRQGKDPDHAECNT